MPGTGKIIVQKRYTRAEIRDNPDRLYVFGDNMEHTGFGGQAREARGEPNTVGIPTKWSPSRHKEAFFDDGVLKRYPEVLQEINGAFDRMVVWLIEGGTVVLPADGVGTGLSELPQRAPEVDAYIRGGMQALLNNYPTERGG